MNENCKRKINGVLNEHGGTRKNGKVASERTQTITREVIYSAFRRLWELGYKIENPQNLREEHVQAIVKHWWFEQKKKPKTIQNDLSRLRRFCEMMGKHEMVRDMRHYLPSVDPEDLIVYTTATRPKSFTSNQVDLVEILKQVDRQDFRLGLMLRMQLSFGLRREEVLKCDPHAQDHGSWFEVLAGQGKGGRPRNVVVMNESQRQILDLVKKFIPKGEKLGWPYTHSGEPGTLKQNLRRYTNTMTAAGITQKNLGVTGHGLRAQFAENNALAHGIVPPTLGGAKNQHEKSEMDTRLKKLSQAMGHNRKEVMGAYYGSFTKKGTLAAADAARVAITEALAGFDELPQVPSERVEDCARILSELQLIELDLTLRQAHALWQKWCERCGVEWARPEREIILCIQTSCSQ